jgi:hypothetical protein
MSLQMSSPLHEFALQDICQSDYGDKRISDAEEHNFKRRYKEKKDIENNKDDYIHFFYDYYIDYTFNTKNYMKQLAIHLFFPFLSFLSENPEMQSKLIIYKI